MRASWWIAILTIAGFLSTAHASEVTQIKGRIVLIHLEGETVHDGDNFYLVDGDGMRRAIVQITKVKGDWAEAYIRKGHAELKMSLRPPSYKRQATSSEPMPETTKRYNFRVSPMGLLVGTSNVNFDVKISSSWTIGPQFSYLHDSIPTPQGYTSNVDITALAFGIRANWFFNGAYKDGFYVGPALLYANLKVTTSNASGPINASASPVLGACLLGYGWFVDNFNIMLGGGLLAGPANITINNSSVSTDLVGLNLESSFGWAF